VAARASGGRTDRGGIGLFLVDAKANGVTRRGYPTQDGMRAADVTLSAVRVGPEAVLAGPDKGLAVLERVVDEAIAALSAEAVGGMAALHELTVEYPRPQAVQGADRLVPGLQHAPSTCSPPEQATAGSSPPWWQPSPTHAGAAGHPRPRCRSAGRRNT
jgi:alkylation response protein AidB-like acyl-CoA dehydrogenase